MSYKRFVKFDLGEALVLRSDQVGKGDGIHMLNNALILTTRNVYFIEHGFWGTAKDCEKYPLKNLVIANGIPQAFRSKNNYSLNVLDLYFTTGQVSFAFNWKREVEKWIKSITDVVLNEDLEDDGIPKMAITCPKCGATLSGLSGTAAKCPYCDSLVYMPR